MTTLIHAELPDQLVQPARRMVERGWAADVEWGLKGSDCQHGATS